jgi:hypothetical protein
MIPPTLDAPPHLQAKIKRLHGLPYICIEEPLDSVNKVVGQLLDGSKIRAAEIEDVWNRALIVDALEQPGAWQGSMATPHELEVLIHAERLFGVDIVDALPIYLAMPRSSYAAWEQRPRVKWPKVRAN